MRALLSWDVKYDDPQYDQIMFDLGGILPSDRTRSLTNHSALIDPITTAEFKNLAKELQTLIARYPDRLYFTFSLHPAGATIWGHFRPTSAHILDSDDSLGFGPGSGVPG